MFDGSMMGWFWIWPVLVLAGLVLLGYVAYGLAQGGGSGSGPGRPSALQILDERYARGEIDDDDYRKRRSELM